MARVRVDADETAATWKALAKSYEAARTRPDSLDVLMEFPAQLSLIGDVAGKRILDLACGSGAKAIHLAHEGAREVVGVDISETFVDDVARLEPPPTARFLRGDISHLDEIEGLSGRFDVVLLLNALGYAEDELATLRAIRALTDDDGAFVLARPSPSPRLSCVSRSPGTLTRLRWPKPAPTMRSRRAGTRPTNRA